MRVERRGSGDREAEEILPLHDGKISAQEETGQFLFVLPVENSK